MASGNDAGYTVAVNTARIVSGNTYLTDEDAVAFFVELMNLYAVENGLANSYFTNPVGWDDDAQYTTTDDLAKLAVIALQSEVIREITSEHSRFVVFTSGENITWKNTNALIDPESVFFVPEVSGLKTGTTDAAGCCILASFSIGDRTYIAVITGCSDDHARYQDVHRIIAAVKQNIIS